MTYVTKLPSRIFFHFADHRELGRTLCETDLASAGSIEAAAQSIDDYTIGFVLLEDGVETDASEDVAAAWMKLHGDEVEFDKNDEPLVPQFIIDHAGDALDDLAGEIACEVLNNQRHNEHVYARSL